jgi:hypothetical protein
MMSGIYSNVPFTEEGYKIFPLTILVEFLVISLFHEPKIPILDMKVQVSTNFSKNWEKMKSPSSVRNGRVNTSKCRGNFQKMKGRSSKMPKCPFFQNEGPKNEGPFFQNAKVPILP